jgi:shikimate kinase
VEIQRPENIVLVGFMGSGKSSVGRIAARTLGFQFLDTDQLAVERAGRSIADIFAEEGETAFRDLETAIIRSLAPVQRSVIATGGGAVIRAANREMLRRTGFVVCLTASEDVIFERVSRNNKRPLLQCENPREAVHRLLLARNEAYEAVADCCLDTSNLSQTEAVAALIEAARSHFAWTPSP